MSRPPRSKLLLATVVALIVAGLAAADRLLERTQESELQNEARQLYIDGSRALARGRSEQAVEMLRRAHMLARLNRDYELELIDALLAARRSKDAEPLIDDVLAREPNNGRANLIAARLMLKKGRTAEADSDYHRAIYGEWPNDAAANRIAARLELIDVLAAKGNKKELLAELLPLEEEVGANLAIEKRLAKLYLTAGSPVRAVDVYRRLIHQNPGDAGAYTGLGEVELVQGRYRDAQAAFLAAFRRKPDDVSIRHRMELASTLTALDPTARMLPSLEKYRRSLRILELTIASVEGCAAVAMPDVAMDVSKAPEHVTNEMAEEKLAIAEKLWRERPAGCAAAQESLRLILEKLGQEPAR
ncbi:MAG: tetratricopeptide repeat protein [Acidobacteriota bacterium]|nr:tetratricopeptide repeat protein [Acidobacteriota bacterium]